MVAKKKSAAKKSTKVSRKTPKAGAPRTARAKRSTKKG